MPATDHGEGLARLDNALSALLAVRAQLEMSPGERSALDDRDPGYYLFAIRARMCTLCAHARMAMETSLKALLHAGGKRPARTHDLDRLPTALPVGERDSIRKFFVDVTSGMVSRWREAGAYESSDRPLDHMVLHAYHMVRTSIKVSRHAAHRFADTGAARVMVKVTSEIERKVDLWVGAGGQSKLRLHRAWCRYKRPKNDRNEYGEP